MTLKFTFGIATLALLVGLACSSTSSVGVPQETTTVSLPDDAPLAVKPKWMSKEDAERLNKDSSAASLVDDMDAFVLFAAGEEGDCV